MKISRLFLVAGFALLTIAGCSGGEEGAVGPQGPKGEQGEKGDDGKKGDDGDKGDDGKQGEKGEQGNANVKTFNFSLTAKDWQVDVYAYGFPHAPDKLSVIPSQLYTKKIEFISEDVVKYGAVLVYMKSDRTYKNAWIPLTFSMPEQPNDSPTGYFITYTFVVMEGISLGDVILHVLRHNGTTVLTSSDWYAIHDYKVPDWDFKIVVIAGEDGGEDETRSGSSLQQRLEALSYEEVAAMYGLEE